MLYGLGGKGFLSLLTDDATVIAASGEYIYWVLAIPLAGFSAFLLDGICIGATATRLMLRAMWIASASFFLLYYGLHDTLGNHALWMAFIVYLSLRGIVQGIILTGRESQIYTPCHSFFAKRKISEIITNFATN